MSLDDKVSDATSANTRKRKAKSELNNATARKHFKAMNTRKLTVQSQDEAFSNGALNVADFVKAREYEILALENGIKSSSRVLSSRAFQEVPRELRRRTASHNVKRVPKWLQVRAQKEMRDDKTVIRRKKRILPHQRIRIETIKRMRAMTERLKQRKAAQRLKKTRKQDLITDADIIVTKDDEGDDAAHAATNSAAGAATRVKVRKPRGKQNRLSQPPVPAARFRKRQLDKSWLPTHVYHAKRAHMSSPKEPLWRFAMPITPTEKSYRKTHRATTLRGAIAWDTSYMSTIAICGRESSIVNLLKALSVGSYAIDQHIWGRIDSRWRRGQRSWYGWLHKRQSYPECKICPAYVVWQPDVETDKENGDMETDGHTTSSIDRKAYIRCHPSAFFELWRQLLQLAKVQKPVLKIEDLRYEIGSILITGPQASEALAKVLLPQNAATNQQSALASIWSVLALINNINSLPRNLIISTDVSDPRLKLVKVNQPQPPLDSNKAFELVTQTCVNWPLDRITQSFSLCDRISRERASKQLLTQKAIHKRKSTVISGSTSVEQADDPIIPTVLYTSSHGNANQGSWTILLPWKCVLAVWYPLMYSSLSTGGAMRFGGLEEVRQIAYESQRPWFPADYPGTAAGKEWEARTREQARKSYFRKPKGRRTEYESLDLGNGRKGEIGCGWACDWSVLADDGEATKQIMTPVAREHKPTVKSNIGAVPDGLVTVVVTMVTRGVPQSRARIYRLPSSDEDLRRRWLNLASTRGGKESKIPQIGSADYPLVPDQHDLIGFVTTGNFNLAAGLGTAIGSIVLFKVTTPACSVRVNDNESKTSGDLCIIRNSGESFGRLARWRTVD